MTHQITGSQKITAMYWNRGIKKTTKTIFPKNSIILDINGNNF